MQMFLQRLLSGAPAEWRDMWNDEVLPYLRSERLVAGPGLQIDRRPAGTLIRAVSSGDGGNGGSGGSFTLAAVVTAPAGGYGDGEYAPVTLNSDGTYTITSGGSVAAITPFI